MSARELRAEARAWRRAAEELDSAEHTESSLTLWLEQQSPLLDSWMHSRVMPHMRDAQSNGVPSDLDGLQAWLVDFSRVWFCLFLALECEDEAKEVT